VANPPGDGNPVSGARSAVSPERWLDAGLELLYEGGPDGLSIDALCRRLQRSKGSFYHHFGDREAFRDRLLERWEREAADEVIAVVRKRFGEGETRNAFELLTRLTNNLPRRPESALRAWALQDASVRACVERVDGKRLAFLTEMGRREGRSPARARRRARALYSVFLCADLIYPALSPGELARIYRDLN